MIFYDLFFVQIKISCYFFIRQELLSKAKDRYYCGGKEKAAECYIANKEILKENAKISIETWLKKKKKCKENMEDE